MTRTGGRRPAAVAAAAAWSILLDLHVGGVAAHAGFPWPTGTARPRSSPSTAGDGVRPATHLRGPDSGRSAPYVRVPGGVQFSTAKSVQFSVAADSRHPALKADYILANPPFNVSDWGAERLKDDQRWRFGTPPKGNANFAWVDAAIEANSRSLGFPPPEDGPPE